MESGRTRGWKEARVAGLEERLRGDPVVTMELGLHPGAREKHWRDAKFTLIFCKDPLTLVRRGELGEMGKDHLGEHWNSAGEIRYWRWRQVDTFESCLRVKCRAQGWVWDKRQGGEFAGLLGPDGWLPLDLCSPHSSEEGVSGSSWPSGDWLHFSAHIIIGYDWFSPVGIWTQGWIEAFEKQVDLPQFALPTYI